MTNVAEQSVNRRLTAAFIAANPVNLTLIPRDKVKQQSGAHKLTDQTPRAIQTFRLIPYGETYRPTPTDDGKERAYDFILLGSFDASMEVDDYWVDANGSKLIVVEKMPTTPLNYETRGYVVKHGKN